MRIRICLAVVAGLVLVPALPAGAHEGHESCAGGAVQSVPFVGGPAPGPAFGPFVREIAQSGQANETVLLIHEVFCEDHAPGE
jgi:hypothetical protein